MRDLISFIEANAAIARSPLVPEIALHLATEVTPLWRATQDWLDAHDLPPPFWAFAWAGGAALARHVLDHPELVAGQRVIDFACGGGIVAIAAARAGATHVTAVDVDPFAATAAGLNAAANGVAIEVCCADVSRDAIAPGACDVLLAGDVFYDRVMSARVEPWLRAAARSGARVLVGDPGRAHAPTARVVTLATYDVPTPLDLEGSTIKRASVLEVLP